MKMLAEQDLEPVEKQEARARQRVRSGAVIYSILIAAVICFVLGGPWLSQEAFITAMGRVLSPNWIFNVIGHLVICAIYGFVIASIIFRWPTAQAIVVGTGLFIPLYGLNYLLFRIIAGYPGNEVHVGLEHFLFCLIFAAAYKAFSIPSRRRADGSRLQTDEV
jgi:hypothetical protein